MTNAKSPDEQHRQREQLHQRFDEDVDEAEDQRHPEDGSRRRMLGTIQAANHSAPAVTMNLIRSLTGLIVRMRM